MSWQTELQSWMFPSPHATAKPPVVGQKAPRHAELPIPTEGKPTVLTFLRHCGCPFAKKTILSLRQLASSHPGIHFIAISHSDTASTDNWLDALGGAGKVSIVIDTKREIYAAWGLGVSSFWHVLSPWSLYSAYKLGKLDGIWNRPTESGTRWQTSGSWAVDGNAFVRWGGVSKSADNVGDFEEGVKAVGGK